MENGYEVRTLYGADLIEQTLHHQRPDGVREEITRGIIRLQDEGVRKALIELGWTPPGEAEGAGAVTMLRRVKAGLQSARLERPGSWQSLTTTLSMIESELDDYFEGTSHCALAESSAQQAEAEPVSIPDRERREYLGWISYLEEGRPANEVAARVALCMRSALKYMSQPAPAPVVPEGYALVPKEPTDEMVNCGWRSGHPIGVWRHMLSAAPQPAGGVPEIRAHHPTVVKWRNDAIRASADIADRYGDPQIRDDILSLLTAPQQEDES